MERKRMVLMNRYEVGRLLGMGNFAKVYQGRDTWLGGSVAIKVIDKEKVIKTDWILAEISAMMGLRHPNIVQLYDVVDSETKKYLIMEYLRGGDLYDMVAKGALDEDVVRKYFQQLISAVDYCHSVGVYHRDLKPEKLLLDESGNLKITDFGLCALSNSRRQDGLLHTACGTLTYISPEVINRKGYDGAKADIWSCGVVLFILLAGHLPFYDPSTIWLCKKICSGEYKFPLWFSPEVRKLLAKILVPDPEKRVIIDYIMEDSWFKKGCNPTCMDAFDMTLLSKALNLSGLLEENDDMISLYKILNISGLLEENDGQNAESELLELKELQEPFNLQCYQGAGPILTH